MAVQEKLQGFTEAYLLSLIAEASESPVDESKVSVPFQELGIDSFRILQIIKRLEADFGTLPKTLLFENFNVGDLTRYFLDKHPQILEKKFSGHSGPAARASVPAQVETPRAGGSVTGPLLIREKDAYADAELSAAVKAVFERHKNEGSVSRGTRNIAPHLFIGSSRQGFFHFSRGGNIFLAYAYTGPEGYFPELAAEALRYCREHGLELNIFSADNIREVDGTAFTATTFGAIQRIENLGGFTLQGNRMRRLRYQVAKFEGGGSCRTEEYICGSDPRKARAIADLIDSWCAAKTMVNPLIHIVKEEILAGTLSPDHRIFLTYLDDVLQNAILITPLRAEDNGYLMDLEFYPAEMPLGGLEYAIANIVKVLVAEGRSLLSLGGTYGVKLDASPNADPAIEKILETLRERNLFNDEGNLQFKNKFRTENRSIYLCRPAEGCNPDNVTDIIMMIADPAKFQSPDPEPAARPVPGSAAPPVAPASPVPEAAVPRPAAGSASPALPDAGGRGALLSEAGFNPLNVPDAQVEFDLKTDSWPQLVLPALDGHMARLHRRLQEPAGLEESLKSVFPFRHFVLAGSGREAEHAFFKASGRKGAVLQNLLFPSTLFNQIDNGFTPVEFPSREILDPASGASFKGGPDWDALRDRLERDPRSVAYACLEVDDNAAGGSPMSFQRLKALKELLASHSIPLVLDGTRIVEYARQLIAEDPAMAGRSTWEAVRDIASQADVLLASLTKDFCVKAGGLIALNDAGLYRKAQDLVQEEGIGLDVIDKKLIALSLQQKDAIESLVRERMEAVRHLADGLARRGVPVVRPALGHCVLIHARGIPELRAFRQPAASLLAWMFLGAGVRASVHNAGMLKGTYLNDCVRLAVPVGLPRESLLAIADRLAALLAADAAKADIPELEPEGTPVPGDVHARYRLKALHAASALPAGESRPAPSAVSAVREPLPTYAAPDSRGSGPAADPSAPMAIAIVGMAGRYPKSRTMAELWDNLSQGRDCIETLPEERFQQRLRHGSARKYRGGFIDGVDRFDSLFFGISPREAEGLDPQERLFLEAAWEAIEDAGYYPETLVPEKAPRDVGVFVGAVWAMYQMFGAEEKLAGNDVNPNSFLWSIANRVSYFLNLTGPSLTVDTACSSSLTALHLACEAIRKGECSSAIVGGVNLDLHQSKWDINKAGGALSEDGVCRTFGKGANGYVAGEGIGAVFLKPLDQALRDGDNVQAVIRSVVVNHGGKTSGYTVPNPHAQARLIQAALKQAGLDARTIGYIEAHGTGTELGDPIEISGLTNAFQAYQVEKQGCSVGSVKTNIGHLEAAAGLVGVQKVALQMAHGRLVPSLHSAELNGFIDFAGSPFYVQQKAEPWLPKEVDGVRHPLRAGVSSFGAGGANAHVILERYEGPLRPRGSMVAERVFPLSARNEEQLRDAAIRLRDHLLRDLARAETDRQDVDDISFTLRAGRKSFDHRLAVVAASKAELLDRLGTFLAGGKDASVLAGHVKNAAGITRMLSREEKEAFIQLLSRDRDPRKLAQLWTDGLLADWQGSQPAGTGRRVSLPTYPFADKRHWVERKLQAAPLPGNGPAALHPMIDANDSTFERQVFRKDFHDRQFFIFDHLVSGIPTLPGVAYLDFARKAGELAAGRRVRSIRNILWISPITVADGKPTRAFIELKPQGDAVQFEVFGEGQDGRRHPFSQGRLTYAPLDGEAPDERIDLAAVQARCRKVIDGKDAYPKFKAFGLGLGPSFQVLQEVSRSDEEVLGKLKLPEHILAEFRDFLLHPSLVDGSLQAGMAAQLGGEAKEMFVPYSIGEVEVLHPLQPTCYSYVRSANAPGSKVSKANVLIVDETGKVLVKILDSVGVPLVSVHEKPAAAHIASDATEFPRLFYAPDWIDSPADGAAPTLDPILFLDFEGGLGTLYRDRLAASGGDRRRAARVRAGSAYAESGDLDFTVDPRAPGDWQRLGESLAKAGFALGKVCIAWPLAPAQDGQSGQAGTGESLRRVLDHGVFALLHLAQALARHFPGSKLQILYAYTGGDGAFAPPHEAINGFARTLRIEHPKINAKVLEIREPAPVSERLLDLVLAELESDTQDVATVRYAEGRRQTRTLRRFDPDRAAAPGAGTGFKDKGVYLITGGAGGLGLLFAEHLAERHAARLVLTGRSPLSPEKEARLEAMRKLGAEVAYVVADVSRREDAESLVRETKARYGSLQGILHSAGVLRDSYLKNKTREEMEAVFAPKLFGTLNLDEATRSEGLDFFVTFSSLAALGGNAGQADYAYANHFMDAFGRWRESLRAKGERPGKTLSINWSLWADGGMKLDEQTELFFRRNLGIKPLGREAGIEALAKGLSLDIPQFAALEGVQEKIELAWGLRKKEPAAPPAPAASALPASAAAATATAGTAADQGDQAASVQRELIRIAMEMLKLDADDIAPDKILLDLGFDSIGMTTYANAINGLYKLDITPVLFFEFPSIQDIARHLCAEHPDAIAAVHRRGAVPAEAAALPGPAAAPPAAGAPAQGRPREEIRSNKGWSPAPAPHAAAAASPSGAEDFPKRRFVDMPIAVVGMSGVMPQSDDLEEFWENLREARNLVTEIPRDRWKWEDFDGDPLKERNKTSSRWGGFMREVDKFDPLFFGISPREAEMMDPQQRIFLETVWKAIEDSGHKVSDLAGTRTGLFVGAATRDYADVLASHQCTLDGYTASGNSHSVLVNRVSFLLNLRGPSAPLDTACSSSLVALHRAIESIHSGSCDMAIVGGVQLMLTPSAYISFSAAGMLSPDGKCKSFDKAANGYVRGEGSGAILIKPLAMAEADGDRILAVIKATAENHGGRVTALTAPNPNAQTELLVEAYGKGRVDPATVGFIECHGTGTSLGDPIEIQALSKAFATLYKEHGKPVPAAAHCGLSSVKTNIGHLETAAGIAGVLKVLLALRHKQIPANLHFQELNPYINLKGTPFFIADRTTAWECARDGQGNPLPRRAGVSSFGFGGANAHVVFEEYPEARASAGGGGPQLIVISAKNEDRLRAYAASHIAHLDKQAVNLADMAFTLQVGRDEMPERLAVVAESNADLRLKLASWLEGRPDTASVFRGNARKPKAKPPGAAAARDLAERKDLAGLGEAWIAGETIDWRLLHKGEARLRIALPTYPFARERHWFPIPELPAAEARAGQGRTPALHPLVHRNVSTLSEQKFITELTGEEFFLDDHRVESRKILPGVAYLEMARAAGEIAGEAPVRVLRNIVWLRPLFSEGGVEKAEISLTPVGDGVEFAIRSHGKAAPVTYCTGKLGYDAASGDPDALDLEGIRRRCHEEVIAGKGLYDYLHGLGLHLGKGFQIVQGISATPSEALARLRLPEHLRAGADTFWLHPALMDGSLHASIGLSLKNGTSLAAGLPFTAREIQILRPLSGLQYAYATYAEGEARAEAAARKLNITLLDGQGRVLVRVKDFFMKPFSMEAARKLPGSSPAAPGAAPAARAELHSLLPVWNPVPKDMLGVVEVPASAGILVLSREPAHLDWVRLSFPDAKGLALPPAAAPEAIESALRDLAFDHLVWVAPGAGIPGTGPEPDAAEPAASQETGVLEVFRITKALLNLGFANREVRWTLITSHTRQVTPGEAIRPAHAAVHGFIGSAAKELPRWKYRLLDLDALEDVSARECLTTAWDPQGAGKARRGGQWFHEGLARAGVLAETESPYRQKGVYVVIGGAGGLGEVWSRYMAENYSARLVWIGRRPADAAIEAKLAALGRIGPAPMYLAADATSREELAGALRKIQAVHPAIHGVIHSAIVLRDQTIGNMREADFRAALAAKVDVSVNLDLVFGGLDLDFMAFFSSVISFFRTPGQSNYAAGCAFKDAFAQSLGRSRAYPVKTINWGFWGGVGIVGDEFHKKMIEKVGIGSIEPEEGMAALRTLFRSRTDRMALIKTLDQRVLEDISWPESVVHLPVTGSRALSRIDEALPQQDAPERLQALEAVQPDGEFDDLLANLLLAGLSEAGLLTQGRTRISHMALDKAPPAFYESWLKTGLDHLAARGLLTADMRPVAAAKGMDQVWREWEARKPAWTDHPNQRAQIGLLKACLKGLPDILRGRRGATDVMFPNSSMHLVEGIYKDNLQADYFNDVLGRTLRAFLELRLREDSQARIRILEVGAGTGGTTAKLLPMLKAFEGAIAEYGYTDLSKAFLIHADRAYRPSCPSLRTEIFDVTRPLAGQPIEAGAYDVVIAANVLHATPNIRETLRNSKAALKDGGLLLLNEMCGWSLFLHLTFGLLEGWWLHEDTSLRVPGSPGLTPEAWEKILREEGFAPVRFPAPAAHRFGQQIIAAASDGKVRQRVLPVARPRVSVPSPSPARSAPSPRPAPGAAETRIQPALAAAVPEAMVEEHVRQTVIDALSEGLKLQAGAIRMDASFADYGVDSIVGVNLVGRINETLRIDMETTSLFEYSSVADLTGHILANWAGPIAASLAGPAVAERAPAVPAPAVASPDPRDGSGAVPRQRVLEHVRQAILEALGEGLKIQAGVIDPDAAFADYGVDSITGVNLVGAINARLGVDMETTVLFEQSSVAQLADFVVDRWEEGIAARLAPAAMAATTVPASAARPHRFAPKERSVHVPAPAGAAIRPEFEPIAIIGMSGRFAGSANLEEFWNHLRDGKDLVSEVTRWRKQDCVMSQFVDGKHCSRGSFIDAIDKFDSAFFQISSLEANYMDPQQRIFLEEAWRALEDAGYAGSVDGKNCGVYVGCGSSGYDSLFAAEPPAQAFWGNSDAILPARIAYHLNLQGPAVAIDTACSASLVGIHIACQGLWARETEMALAGGVFLASNPGFYKVANRAGMLSPEGKCQAFDDKADGFVPGEGVGVVVLKRLGDALRDGDSICGVIAASGINQDGKTNGIIAPNAASQERLERAVYDRFGIDPSGIQVIEAHGTGTRLGDPIEFGALTRAFRKYTDRQQFCAIGSVKTNIGHAATAAGVAGVLKLLLSLKHRQIPPSLHFDRGNAAIDFQSSPFYVNTRLRDWESSGKRRAAISSFGFSGTNAHIVLEEAPAQEPSGFRAPGYLVALSAASSLQLRKQAENLLAHCRQAPDLSLNDLCHTLFVGRAHLNHRFTCIARDQADLIRALEAWLAGGSAGHAQAYEINRSTLREQRSLKAFGNQCIRACAEGGDGARYLENLTAIADLYGQGYALDYTALFPEGSRRISLPTYPFAGESHWAEMADPGSRAAGPARPAMPSHQALLPAAQEIHPLLHANVSVLNQQRYRSVFAGDEPFLAGIAGDGRRAFPAAACLEMARAAAVDASPWEPGDSLELREVAWGPLADSRAGRPVEIALAGSGEGRIEFSIGTREDEQDAMLCRGTAVFGGEGAPAGLDIAKLQNLLGGDRQHPPGARQALIPFAAPAAAEDGAATWVLAPGALEAAFRAAARLMPGSDGTARPASLESLRIFAPVSGEGYAWVRSARRGRARDGAGTFDIDILDRQGRVLVQVKALELGGGSASGDASLAEFSSLLAAFGNPAATAATAAVPDGGDGNTSEIFANLLDEIR